MNKLAEYRLTDAEWRKIADSTPSGTYGEGLRAVADAATEKALRGVVLWLQQRALQMRDEARWQSASALLEEAKRLNEMLIEEQPLE